MPGPCDPYGAIAPGRRPSLRQRLDRRKKVIVTSDRIGSVRAPSFGLRPTRVGHESDLAGLWPPSIDRAAFAESFRVAPSRALLGLPVEHQGRRCRETHCTQFLMRISYGQPKPCDMKKPS